MLRLPGIMLSVLCLVSLAQHSTTARPCPISALHKEIIKDLEKLSSKDSSEIVPLNNMMEAGENAATYLKVFTEALKNSKESKKYRHITKKLQNIQLCTSWMFTLKEHYWKPVEEYDFFKNLDHLLKFLGDKTP